MPYALRAKEIELASHHIYRPVALARREEIYPESRGYCPAVGILLPVGGKGEEVIALVIHHRIELVHESVAHPSLCVLRHSGVGVPSVAAVSCEVVVFA